MKHNTMFRTAVVVFFAFSAMVSFSQTGTSIVKFINPASVATPKGYSHAAIVELGNCRMVILSGQVPFDSKGNVIGQNDFGKQTEQVFLNIKNILAELGGTMDNVVKLRIFLTDISQIQTFRGIRDKYIIYQSENSSRKYLGSG